MRENRANECEHHPEGEANNRHQREKENRAPKRVEKPEIPESQTVHIDTTKSTPWAT